MPIGLRPLACAALLAGAAAGEAQTPFEPIPPEQAARYRFDFPRNFYATPEAERKARSTLKATLAELEKLKGRVASSPETLLRALELSDRAVSQAMPHVIYLYLRFATNTRDQESQEAQNRLIAELNTRTSFLQQELMRIEAAQFRRFAARKPALQRYAFVVRSARRLRPHTLGLREEEILSTLAPHLGEWQGELHQASIDHTDWPRVQDDGRQIHVHRQEGDWRNSPHRRVREEGFKGLYAGYRSHRDFYAFALLRQVKARNEVARLRRYRDYPAEAHFALHLTTQQVKDLFRRLEEQGEFNKRYQRLRAERVKQIGGFDEVNVWDLTVTPKALQRPRFTIGEATRVIRDALAPFGQEHGRELAELLDPANGRLDLVPGEHRVPGAFAWGMPGSQKSIFYSFNYEGYFDDVSALAHEAGHAVHYELMANNRVPPAYTSGPTYFTESFAMLNELLVADHLYRQAGDDLRRTYFLEQFLGQAMSVFGVGRQAALEQAVYDQVQAGKARTPDDLDRLAREIGARTSIWHDRHPELAMEWIAVHHFYRQPMYYVNYVWANFLSLKYYQMMRQDPSGFIRRYVALMRNGFDAPPAELLKKFVGLRLDDPKLVADAFSVLEGRIRELEALYARTGG